VNGTRRCGGGGGRNAARRHEGRNGGDAEGDRAAARERFLVRKPTEPCLGRVKK
jgi:hypothetical protein